MKLAVMQPYFFPYIGYFSLIDSVDTFMFFDDVQYLKKSWMGRNRLLNINKNEPFYIRPEIKKGLQKILIQDVKLSNSDLWKDKLFDQIVVYKNKAKYFSEVKQLLVEILSKPYENLVDLNMDTTIKIAEYIGIETKFDTYRSHNFWFREKPTAGEWGLRISEAMKAEMYINSPGGESFIFPEPFSDKKIKLGFIKPNLTSYSQGSDSFIAALSILDVLMFNGQKKTLELIKNYTIDWKN